MDQIKEILRNKNKTMRKETLLYIEIYNTFEKEINEEYKDKFTLYVDGVGNFWIQYYPMCVDSCRIENMKMLYMFIHDVNTEGIDYIFDSGKYTFIDHV